MHSITCHTINPQLYDIFAGLDVDYKSISASFVDLGQMLNSIRTPYKPNDLMWSIAGVSVESRSMRAR